MWCVFMRLKTYASTGQHIFIICKNVKYFLFYTPITSPRHVTVCLLNSSSIQNYKINIFKTQFVICQLKENCFRAKHVKWYLLDYQSVSYPSTITYNFEFIFFACICYHICYDHFNGRCSHGYHWIATHQNHVLSTLHNQSTK